MLDIYIKGRCDRGKGKSAIVAVRDGQVIYEKSKALECKTMLYKGKSYDVDSINCEVMAAIAGLVVAELFGEERITFYINSMLTKWYEKSEYPYNRFLMDEYAMMAEKFDIKCLHINKYDQNPFNCRVNVLARSAK